ncbi:distal tail protein Dit [Oceanobacillus sp. FSL H7-0719]|uniref:distal tail protein Dit n=1 Tax=Oceanobacillus sp. FSL H7-0719 TaxID=2954507 RepID=UPI00324C996C
MIGESKYFSFDGRKSTDYPIININVSTGSPSPFSESVGSGKTINEVYPRKAFRPHFYGVQKSVKQFSVSFAFTEPWNDDLMDEIIMWLNTDEYKPLFFEADVDRVFYAMPVEDIGLIHNGLKEGYLTLTFRCDSAYSYSHEIITPIYDTIEEDLEMIEITNRGHYKIYPEMWIEKIDDGDLVLNNLTNGNQEMRFENIDVGEVLHIKCQTEIIKTSKEDTFRYEDFNDVYLEILYGKNRIKLSKNMRIRIKYQYIYS